jgi:hypothetical protein
VHVGSREQSGHVVVELSKEIHVKEMDDMFWFTCEYGAYKWGRWRYITVHTEWETEETLYEVKGQDLHLTFILLTYQRPPTALSFSARLANFTTEELQYYSAGVVAMYELRDTGNTPALPFGSFFSFRTLSVKKVFFPSQLTLIFFILLLRGGNNEYKPDPIFSIFSINNTNIRYTN